jgi:uncharacterized repeat protein (TIGR03843 family)
MPGDERAPELAGVADLALGPAEAERLLGSGELEVLGAMPRSSNATFLAKVRPVVDSDPEVLAIYKPRRGESPLWDFPAGTLAAREVAAYRVARELGWPDVPPTVLREGPEGEGSAQLFRGFDPAEHAFTLVPAHREAFRRIAAFDVVVNNADRKGGHTLLAADGTIFVIDHGVCFHVLPKLRTVIWEFENEPLGDAIAADLAGLRDGLTEGTLREELAPLLHPSEVDATAHRIARLLAAGAFPSAEESFGPPYPWPAI